MLALRAKAGADGAEVLVRDGTELEVKVRLGEPELIKEAGSRALGLRVIKDQRAAVTYTSDLTAAGMERFARDSVELAALAEPDPVAALPAREEMARDVPELDLWDETRAVPRCRGGASGARAPARRRRSPRQARDQLRRRGFREDASARRRLRRRPGFSGSAARYACVASPSSRSATTPTARSATGRTGPRRASPPGSRTPRRLASRPRAARSRSWARARSRRARHR